MLEGEPDFNVVAEVGSGEEAVRVAVGLKPDVVLMDLRFGRAEHGIDGVEAVRLLTAGCPVRRW